MDDTLGLGADPFGTGEGLAAPASLEHESSRDTAYPDIDPILATPRNSAQEFVAVSGSISRPTTRSVARLQASENDQSLGVKASPKTSLFSRLQSASTRLSTGATSSRLEDAEDIQYEDEDDDDEDVEDQADQAIEVRPSRKRKARSHSMRQEAVQSRVPVRRSARINPKKAALRESTPESAIIVSISSVTSRNGRPRKTRKLAGEMKLPTRRSARLAKPLTQFHKYNELPPELKIHIWEAAVTPRVVYIRNRSAVTFTADVQNKQPTSWFTATKIASEVAKRAYRPMFGLHSPNNAQTRQAVNPDIDIVVLEPCCNGCRGYYCSRHQFSNEDRNAVRFMAIQTESPFLIPSTSPCWVTISNAWPNVETLYLTKAAVKGISKGEKAVIRMKEGEHETTLRKRFDEWKKGDGLEKKMATLEFVFIVDKEPETKARKDRYSSVEDRNTGSSDDIILD